MRSKDPRLQHGARGNGTLHSDWDRKCDHVRRFAQSGMTKDLTAILLLSKGLSVCVCARACVRACVWSVSVCARVRVWYSRPGQDCCGYLCNRSRSCGIQDLVKTAAVTLIRYSYINLLG